jgi:carboxypeptidase C (cathepsin A)
VFLSFGVHLRTRALCYGKGGVGFSTCEGTECVFDDNNSAQDNLVAILNWFKLFPEFQGHDLYISGESYAGIYVPYVSN